VLPHVATERVNAGLIPIEWVSSPIDAAAPVISARRPAPQGICGTKCDTSGNESGTDVARVVVREIVGRILGVRPFAVDDGRIVVGHVYRVGICRLDGDDLPVLFLTNRDLLLRGRCQLVVRLSLRAQPLDRIHHVGLLRKKRIAEFLCPIELGAHHGEHGRRCNQCLHAAIPRLLVHRGLQLIVLELLVFSQPPIGLHHLY
jgi:hypothetical protein